MTKIFCDIADKKLIRKFSKKSIVRGFTTNPSLMRNAGAKNYTIYAKKILKITKKPVSLEVFGDDEKSISTSKIIKQIIPYAEKNLKNNGCLWDISKHILKLIKKTPGAKSLRKELSEKAQKKKADITILENIAQQLEATGH